MTSISTNAYIDKSHERVNKYNCTYHSTTKVKATAVRSSTYLEFQKENNENDTKFKVSDHVRVSRYKGSG